MTKFLGLVFFTCTAAGVTSAQAIDFSESSWASRRQAPTTAPFYAHLTRRASPRFDYEITSPVPVQRGGPSRRLAFGIDFGGGGGEPLPQPRTAPLISCRVVDGDAPPVTVHFRSEDGALSPHYVPGTSTSLRVAPGSQGVSIRWVNSLGNEISPEVPPAISGSGWTYSRVVTRATSGHAVRVAASCRLNGAQ